MTATLYRKPKWPVERRQLILAKPPCLPLTQTHPCHADPALYLIVEWHCVASKMEPRRKRLQAVSRALVDEFGRIEADPCLHELIPARDLFQLTSYSEPDALGREPRERTPRPAP